MRWWQDGGIFSLHDAMQYPEEEKQQHNTHAFYRHPSVKFITKKLPKFVFNILILDYTVCRFIKRFFVCLFVCFVIFLGINKIYYQYIYIN